MTCREVTEILSEFVSGELAPDAAARLDAHFELCPNCRIFLVQFTQTVEIARAAGTAIDDNVDVPQELIDAVLAAVKAEER
jgi:anti-sigma factor RsiW